VEEKPELFFQPPDCIDDRVGWQNAVHVERDLQSKVAEACKFFQKMARSGRNVYLVNQLPATFGGRHRDGLCQWLRHFLSGRFPVQRRVARTYSGAVGRVLILYNSRKRPNRTRQAQRINIMNSSTTDKVKGTAKEVTGKVKEETGKAIGNRNLQDRGTAEKVAGKVERKVGEVKKVFGK
jgi:uncharacterized protein YjbJ (UPF0337 family)